MKALALVLLFGLGSVGCLDDIDEAKPNQGPVVDQGSDEEDPDGVLADDDLTPEPTGTCGNAKKADGSCVP